MLLPLAVCLQVVVGGIDGYSDLANPANFTDGVSTGRLCLGTHANGVIDEGQGGINIQVGQAWSKVGPGVAEFGLEAPGFFATSYDGWWVGNKLTVSEANVNVDYSDPQFVAKFEAFVDEGRSVGQIPNFAPILSPNSVAFYDGSQSSLGTGFFDPKWDALRAAAMYGGGIALDTPPMFVFDSPPWYLAFVEQEIRWGNTMGLRTSVIVSPYAGEASTFLADAQAFEQRLAADNALPSQWVVENYVQNPDGTYPTDATFPNPIGSEATPNTVANVATWFARNAPAAIPDQGATIVEQANGIAVPTASAATTNGSWLVQGSDGDVSDIFVGAPDGSYLVKVGLDRTVTVYLYTPAGTLIGTWTYPPT